MEGKKIRGCASLIPNSNLKAIAQTFEPNENKKTAEIIGGFYKF